MTSDRWPSARDASQMTVRIDGEMPALSDAGSDEQPFRARVDGRELRAESTIRSPPRRHPRTKRTRSIVLETELAGGRGIELELRATKTASKIMAILHRRLVDVAPFDEAGGARVGAIEADGFLTVGRRAVEPQGHQHPVRARVVRDVELAARRHVHSAA